MANWISTKTENNLKIVTMHWSSAKKRVLFFTLFIFVILSVSVLIFPAQDASFEKKLSAVGSLLVAFFILMLLGYFIYYPRRISIIKDNKGNMYLKKRDWFFITKEYYVKAAQNPVFIAKRISKLGIRILLTPAYRLLVRYIEQGESKEINLQFTSSYFLKASLNPGSILLRDQHLPELSEAIVSFLRMKWRVEE